MMRANGEFEERYLCGCVLRKPSLEWKNLCSECMARKRYYEKKFKGIKFEDVVPVDKKAA